MTSPTPPTPPALARHRFYGHRQRSRTLAGVELSCYDYTVPTTDWHYHERPYFMYVLSGHMAEGRRGGEVACPPGSLVLTNWQDRHYGRRVSATAAGFHVTLDGTWPVLMDGGAAGGSGSGFPEGSQLLSDPRVHLGIAALYREFVIADADSALAVESEVLALREAFTPGPAFAKTAPPWVARLREALSTNEEHWTLARLADDLGLHPAYLSRAAPHYLRTGISAYRRLCKLRRAMPLLLDPGVQLSDVAYRSGFADQSHFNRVFKSVSGRTPGQYRRDVLGLRRR